MGRSSRKPSREAELAERQDRSATELVTLTRALVEIPSPTGSELGCARFLRDWFREHSVDAHLQHVEPRRANVVAAVPGARRGPTLLLNGHPHTSWSGDPTFDDPALGEPGRHTGPLIASDGPPVGIADLVAAQQLYVGLARRLVA